MTDPIDPIVEHLTWLRAQKSARPNTLRDREGALRRANRDLPLGLKHVCEADLDKYLGNPDWSPNTRNVYWRHLAQFYDWAYRRGHLDFHPMAHMDRPPPEAGEPRPITMQELEYLLEYALQPWWLCALFASAAGLRALEIAALRREDITEDTIYLRVTKGGRRQSVPTPADVWEAIGDYPRGSLIEHLGGIAEAHWVTEGCSRHFQRKRPRGLGMPGVTLHVLRHTAAFRLRAAGADAFTIQRFMRHKSLRSTQIYCGASEGECRQAVRSLPRLVPASR